MLMGLVAAGFYGCFFGGKRGALRTGIGAAGLEMFGFLFPDIRFAVFVLSASWLMLAGLLWGAAFGGGLTEGPAGASGESGGERAAAVRRQQLFLAGGMWLMARSMAEVWAGNAPSQVGSLPAAIVTALFTMTGLYLLGRGKLYPLWMAVLAVSWLLAGYLCGIAYARPWQGRIMAAAVYLTLGGILVFQQIDWIRQELGRSGREERRWEPLAGPGGFGTSSGTNARWHEAAWREYRQLRIFEHDFRHHLDIVAALYEEGSGEEARAYIGDLKQARETRQGRREGGERELSYIMMAKKEACRQSGISFSYQIIGCPRGIAQMDMTALLLNLLDNAIRACGEVPGSRSIAVMLLSRGVFWEIEMANAGHYGPEEERGEGLQDGGVRQVHGIGMASVRQIVEKYQGTYRIWEEGGLVRQKLILVQRGALERPEPGDTE